MAVVKMAVGRARLGGGFFQFGFFSSTARQFLRICEVVQTTQRKPARALRDGPIFPAWCPAFVGVIKGEDEETKDSERRFEAQRACPAERDYLFCFRVGQWWNFFSFVTELWALPGVSYHPPLPFLFLNFYKVLVCRLVSQDG